MTHLNLETPERWSISLGIFNYCLPHGRKDDGEGWYYHRKLSLANYEDIALSPFGDGDKPPSQWYVFEVRVLGNRVHVREVAVRHSFGEFPHYGTHIDVFATPVTQRLYGRTKEIPKSIERFIKKDQVLRGIASL